jgi:hypothetical protein
MYGTALRTLNRYRYGTELAHDPVPMRGITYGYYRRLTLWGGGGRVSINLAVMPEVRTESNCSYEREYKIEKLSLPRQ